jgi:hypothetical protein
MPSDQAKATAEYRMEFLSDSYLMPASPGDPEYTDSGVKLQYYSTKALAYYYGKCVHLMLSGMANGKSITTELRNIPSEPMGTVYLQAAGTVGRFRANGTTFAFDSQGLIAGCDAMLDGGAGLVSGATGADWFPMMVPAANLATVTPTTSSNPALANTIAAPAGFDPMAPGNIWASFGTAGVEGDVYAVELDRPHAVAAATESITRESVSKSLTWLLEVPYSLTFTTENLTSVAISSGTFAAVTALVDLLAGGGAGVIADPPASGSGSGTALLSFTPQQNAMTWNANYQAYGFTFTLTAEKVIKGVGVYDVDGNGLSGAYGVGLLYNSTSLSGNIPDSIPFDEQGNIYSVEVPSGTTTGLSGPWRRVDLEVQGATLAAGNYTLWLGPMDMNYVDNLALAAAGVAMTTNATYGELYYWDMQANAGSTGSFGTPAFGAMLFFE